MRRSLRSVSTYFSTQAPVYQVQAQLIQTYAIRNIPAPVIIARNKRYRKVTYKHKPAPRDINLSYTILA